MEPEKQKSNSATTLVLEKEEEIKDTKVEIKSPSLSPKIESLIKQKLEKKDTVENKVKINLESLKPKEILFDKKEEIEKVKEETKKEENIVEPLYQNVNEINEEETIEELPKQKPQKSKKLRMKLVLIVATLVLTTMIGWTIGNSIAIHNQGILLETQQTEYQVNLSSYIIKISGLDGILGDDEKPDTLKPIESEVKVIPEKMVPPQHYTKRTNWFDNICNWLSKLFRR